MTGVCSAGRPHATTALPRGAARAPGAGRATAERPRPCRPGRKDERFNVDAAFNHELQPLFVRFHTICMLLQAGLVAPLDIVDMPIMSQGGNVSGYVARYGRAHDARRGRIHLDFTIVTPNNEWTVAHTLVHEASHKFAHTEDHAYLHQHALIANLATADAMNNADSIAAVVINTFRDQLQ